MLIGKVTRKRASGMLKKYGADVREHVMEIYSPKRVNAMAEKMGMIPGLSLDLTTVDPDDGMPWDFNDINKHNKARRTQGIISCC